MSIGWQGRLDEATTPHDIVDVARDFLASWSPEEIFALPAACRPWKIVDADDVNSYSIQLAQEHCSGEMAPLLDRMSNFFSNASQRLSQILAYHPDPGGEVETQQQ